MTCKVARFEHPSLVERHKALNGTELVLMRHADDKKLFTVMLVTPVPKGCHVEAISGWHAGRQRTANRLMDMHAAVVAQQRAAAAVAEAVE